MQGRACRLPEHPHPVIIEGDNLIGMYSLILKGSRIGKGAVIGAGSVVAGEIPPNVVAAGIRRA